MRKKLLVVLGVVLVLILAIFCIPAGIVLAKAGIDGFQAYIKALEFGLAGLREFFNFIIQLFNASF
jgi:hypothetical protein